MRKTPISICLLVSLASVAHAWEQPSTTDILNTSRVGVVKIDVTGQVGQSGAEKPYENHGSGFVLTPDGYVVTSAHLFPESLHNELITGRLAYYNVDDEHSAKPTKLILQQKDYGTDGALLKFAEIPLGMRPLPSTPEFPLSGEPLFVLGFPAGQDTMTRDDVVSEAKNHYFDNLRYQYHGIANPGNSGGPIFNKEGLVVGIVANEIKSIGGIDVSGVHEAASLAAIPFPDSFNWAEIRPLFFPTTQFHFTLDDENDPGWSLDQQREEAKSYFTKPLGTFCGITANYQWSLRKLNNGFLISPPPNTALANSAFTFQETVENVPSFQAEYE
jgi:hypothetical protein